MAQRRSEAKEASSPRIQGTPLGRRVSLGIEGLSSPLGTPGSTGNKGRFAQMTLEEMNRKFEEWMKITAENKITTKNSWSLSLIDYFTELRFLKNNENEINFQKASYTLDGCVKVYSSRVDSIATEAERLLVGLNENQETEKKENRKRTMATRTMFLERNQENLLLKRMCWEDTPELHRSAVTRLAGYGAKGLGLQTFQTTREGGLLFDAGYSLVLDKTQPATPEDIIEIPFSQDCSTRVLCPSVSEYIQAEKAHPLPQDALENIERGLSNPEEDLFYDDQELESTFLTEERRVDSEQLEETKQGELEPSFSHLKPERFLANFSKWQQKSQRKAPKTKRIKAERFVDFQSFLIDDEVLFEKHKTTITQKTLEKRSQQIQMKEQKYNTERLFSFFTEPDRWFAGAKAPKETSETREEREGFLEDYNMEWAKEETTPELTITTLGRPNRSNAKIIREDIKQGLKEGATTLSEVFMKARDRGSETSAPQCFLSMLHLAGELGLVLKQTENLNDVRIEPEPDVI